MVTYPKNLTSLFGAVFFFMTAILMGYTQGPPPTLSDVRLGSFIVQVHQGVNPQQAARSAAQLLVGRVNQVYTEALQGFAITVAPGYGIADLQQFNWVKHVEADLEMHAFGQTLPTGVDRIEVDRNSTANLDGRDDRVDVAIAIIDTGVDLDHPDLNVVFGGDATKGPSITKGGGGNDDNGHGSHVAGIAAALDNGIGVVGVAPGAKIWAIKVLKKDGSGFLSDVIEGIDFVTQNADQIEVANLSLGGQGRSDAFRTAIQNSVNAGVFYAVSAGNDSKDVYGEDGIFPSGDDIIPAAYPEVSTISALSDTDGIPGGNGPSNSFGGQDDSFAFFSNFSQQVVSNNPVRSSGAAIDWLLPGVDIFSTWKDGGFNTISGTSMASPHGAGLAALFIAANGRDQDGDGDHDASDVYAIRQALIDSGVTQDNANGLAIQNDPDVNKEPIGWAASGAPSVNITHPVDGAAASGIVDVTATASDDDGSVSQVAFFVDGSPVGIDSDGSDGWSASWDTTLASEGDHVVSAEATDNENKTAKDSISVTVDNNSPPSVTISNPNDGAAVSGIVDVTATASDNDGSVAQVAFFVDGSPVGIDSDGSDGWSTSWDTTTVADGDRRVTAEVTDDAGESSSHSITVIVDNIQESAPTVDSLSLSEVNTGGSPHAEFSVTWSVSDGDSNLDTITLTLYELDRNGNRVAQEDSVLIDISGSSAAGTVTLKARFDENNGKTYLVEGIVTDTNGHTGSHSATEVEDGF